MIKTGGCLCGETRYQISAEPLRSSVCHCRYCQLRTGSAFGVSIYFQDDEVTLLSGTLDYFSYSTESGHSVKMSYVLFAEQIYFKQLMRRAT